MLPTLVIFFREALEASLIVGIILAYLHRVGRPGQARPVWFGIAVAVALDVVFAAAVFHVIENYRNSPAQRILEGGTYLLATALLTYMSFWMQGESRVMKREIEARVDAALGRGSVAALALLSAVTVGREGLETVLFTLAIAFHTRPLSLALGAALGLAAGLAVSYSVYRLGRRVPLGLFFKVLGVLLLVFAAGLLANGVADLQGLGWLPLLRGIVWHTGHLLSGHSPLGNLLHGMFGYSDSPTALQAGAYAIFLGISIWAYLRPQQGGRPGAPDRSARV